MSKKKIPCPVCEGRCSTGKVLPIPCFNCDAVGTVDSVEDEKEETTEYPGRDRANSPPPAGDKPNIAIGKLVLRIYYVGGEPAMINNMHNVLDERIDSRAVLLDLFTRAAVQDGDEFFISVQRIGPKFPDEKWSIGEGGKLEKSASPNKIILPG